VLACPGCQKPTYTPGNIYIGGNTIPKGHHVRLMILL